jgi:hypothetical protein
MAYTSITIKLFTSLITEIIVLWHGKVAQQAVKLSLVGMDVEIEIIS